MEDIIEGTLKALGCMWRYFINFACEFGGSGPGKVIVKVFWPPYWLKKIDCNENVIYFFSFVFYVVTISLFMYFCCKEVI